MSSLNEVRLVGNLGNDPELRYTPNGNAVTELRVATNEFYKDKSGKLQKKTEWHRVIVWNKAAESCATYLSKGRSVLVSGRLQTRKWEDKNKVVHYTTEVVAQRVQFLGGAPKAQATQQEVLPFAEEETQVEQPVSVADMVL